MRIEKLLIPAFGPFTGREFDFTPGHGKLEILYGLNEAGKSSLLRAIYALLYGVPGQTPDDFLHPYKSLRIGATLEHEGARLSFFRRKANKDSLLKADNLSVLPDQDLRAFVPIPEESFATMFGLDAERLAEGGKELLEGGGEYGALLFGAATGIVALRQIQQQLDAGADRLFRPSTAKSVIRGILAARDDARKRIRETSFTALNLKDLLERREAASSAQRGLDDSLRALSTEVARLERLRMIHPLLDSRRNCLAALSGLGEALLLREAFASEFEEFRRRGQAAAAERSGLEARIASLQASLSRLQFSTPLIDGKDRIAGLHQLLGAHLKAQQDLPKLRAALALLQQQMSGLLRKLGASPEMEAAAALRVPEHDALLAGELIEEAAVRSANLSQALQDESNHAAGCDSARRELQDLPEDIPDHALRDACQAALALTEIERLVPARLQKLAAAQASLGNDLAALPWPGDIASLSRAALPAVAAVHAWKTRLADAADAVKSMRQAVLDASREVEVCGAALSRGKAARPLPSLDDLHASRDRRQSQWSLIRRAWLGEPPAAAERAQSGPAASEPPALAGAYEGAVEMADRIADELREHADEVAQLAQAQADLHSAQSRLQARQAESAEAASGEQRLLSEWASLWAPHAVDAGSPEQMLAWIERRGRLLGEDAALSADQRSIDLDVARLEQARKDLLEALRPFAVEPLPRDVSFNSLRRMAESRLAELSRVRQMRSVIQDRLAQSEQNLAQARLKLDALRHQESEWRGKWATLLARIHLHPPVEPPALKVILALRNDLSQRQDEAAGLGARIASIERDAHAFERDVRGLCGLLSPDLQDHDPPPLLLCSRNASSPRSKPANSTRTTPGRRPRRNSISPPSPSRTPPSPPSARLLPPRPAAIPSPASPPASRLPSSFAISGPSCASSRTSSPRCPPAPHSRNSSARRRNSPPTSSPAAFRNSAANRKPKATPGTAPSRTPPRPMPNSRSSPLLPKPPTPGRNSKLRAPTSSKLPDSTSASPSQPTFFACPSNGTAASPPLLCSPGHRPSLPISPAAPTRASIPR